MRDISVRVSLVVKKTAQLKADWGGKSLISATCVITDHSPVRGKSGPEPGTGAEPEVREEYCFTFF